MSESISSDHVSCMQIGITQYTCVLVKQISKSSTWLMK